MDSIFKKMAVALGIFLMGALLTTTARAECGKMGRSSLSLQPQSWQGQNDFGSASLRLASDDDSDDSIVGMWHVLFTAKGNVGPGLPPDGAPVDNAIAQWHSDGTEIMNSGRNPATQSFCLGVWKKVSFLHYKLNHFAISWDPTVDPNNPQGPANIREDVILSPDGKTFKGTFTIDQYDESGNLLIQITGLLSGTRITVDTPVSGVL